MDYESAKFLLPIISIAAALLVPVVILFFRDTAKQTILPLAGIFTLYAAVELFDLLALVQPGHMLLWKNFSIIAEGLLAPFWLGFSLVYGRKFDLKSVPILQKMLFAASVLLAGAGAYYSAEAFFFSPDFAGELILFLELPAFWFYLTLLVFLIISFVNLETTLANTELGTRWKIKLELVGFGLLLAVLIFYYSQPLLYRTINMNLVPVRALALLIGSLLIGYSRVTRGESSRISISRQVAFKSVVLLTIGIYLIILGVIGEGMRYFGNPFERSLLIILAFLLGAGLLIVLLSETVKRKIHSFLHNHFFEQKYDYRLQWLAFTTRISMSGSKSELYTSILSVYCDTFGFGNAVLFLYDYNRKAYFAFQQIGTGSKIPEFHSVQPVVRHMIEKFGIVDLRHKELVHDPLQQRFIKDDAILFFIPLRLNEKLDGFIALGRPLNTTEKYTEEDFDLMMVMVRQATSALLNFRLAEQLAQARDMEALGKVSAFVAHDLKNLVYSLSLVLENAQDHLDNPEFQEDMLETVGSTVSKMKILIAQLKSLPEKKTLQTGRIELVRLARETAAMISSETQILVSGKSTEVIADKEELQKVLLNLLLNGLEALEGEGKIRVQIQTKNGNCGIAIQDNGCGIDENFLRNDLFTPFKTTKKKGLGIGLYQCKQIIEAHNGRIEVQSKVGVGTTFTVWLPAVERS